MRKTNTAGEAGMAMRWTMVIAAAAALEIATIGGVASQPKAKPTLDYDFYKARVEPIFLKKKEGHVRCVVCHSDNNSAFKLQTLPDGARAYTDEQSHKNFEMVSKLTNPGDPMISRLTMHPLAPEGGGDVFHSGGRQFMSVNDPDWKTMAAWINGATLASRSKK
jgi:hypothetical protein